jgi:hypothetical protein
MASSFGQKFCTFLSVVYSDHASFFANHVEHYSFGKVEQITINILWDTTTENQLFES